MKAVLFALAAQLTTNVLAFVSTTQSKVPVPANGRICLSLKQSSSPGSSSDKEGQQQDPVEPFMEEASRKGAKKVKEMSVEERTKRAMLAEAVEDRIFTMYDDLEGLLQDGVPATDEDRDEISSLAKQIKASQSQYENLVSGKPSAMLNIGSESDEEA